MGAQKKFKKKFKKFRTKFRIEMKYENKTFSIHCVSNMKMTIINNGYNAPTVALF